jgi:hypothetical protein
VVVIGIVLILGIGVYTYVSINKQSIIKQVTDEIGKNISGKVSIADVDLSFFSQFPKIAVRLNDVRITDSMFVQHGHAFFHADKLFARLSITKLVRKQAPLNGISIEKGEVYMYTDSAGYTKCTCLNKRKILRLQQAAAREALS